VINLPIDVDQPLFIFYN